MTSPGTRRVLVVNAGSSSLKYQLVDPVSGRSDATGLIERIGLPAGRARHTCASGTHVHELTVPDHVDVRKVDLSIELQILAYHEQRKTQSLPELVSDVVPEAVPTEMGEPDATAVPGVKVGGA